MYSSALTVPSYNGLPIYLGPIWPLYLGPKNIKLSRSKFEVTANDAVDQLRLLSELLHSSELDVFLCISDLKSPVEALLSLKLRDAAIKSSLAVRLLILSFDHSVLAI